MKSYPKKGKSGKKTAMKMPKTPLGKLAKTKTAKKRKK